MPVLKSFERIGKKLLLFALRLVFNKGKHYKNIHDKHNTIKKILILRLEQKMGNLVMTTFFPKALKEIYPEADVDLFIHDTMKSIWDNNPNVNKILLFSNNTHLFNPIKMMALMHSIRKSRYDIVIDCSTPSGFSLSNALVAKLTGGTYRVGFQRGASDCFLNCAVAPDNNKYYVEIMHDLLTVLTPDVKYYSPKIYLTDSEISNAREELADFDIGRHERLIYIWVGARYYKQWDIEHFRVLAGSLRSNNLTRVLYLCGPEEKKHYEYLSENEPGSALYIDDIRKLAGLITVCELFVSGDTGPLHLAAVLAKSTVGIYFRNNYSIYGYDDGAMHKVVDLSNELDNVKKVAAACHEIL